MDQLGGVALNQGRHGLETRTEDQWTESGRQIKLNLAEAEAAID